MFLELVLVIAVTDGDTIRVLDHNKQQIKVRLASIDAPERKQPFGTKSKQMLANLIGNKRVNLDCPKKDIFQKRQVCSIKLNGVDINREMVARGGAWVYRAYYKGSDYLDIESIAKSNNLGLWNTSEYQSIPPWEWRKNKRKSK
jgi:micrococcal nuclease